MIRNPSRFGNVNYNYEEKMILNAIAKVTPLIKRTTTKFVTSKFNPLTKDLIKESLKLSNLIINEISSVRNLLDKSQLENIKEFFKAVRLIKINLTNFLNMKHNSKNTLFKSRIALGESSQFLKEIFEQARKSTNMEILGDVVCDSSFKLDYFLTRLSATLLNISNMEEQIDEDELDHYWLRMMKSGFRSLLTEKVGIKFKFGGLKKKMQDEILENFRKEESENEEILGNVSERNLEKDLEENSIVTNFGEKYQPEVAMKVRKMVFKQFNEFKRLDTEEIFKRDKKEEIPEFGYKTFMKQLKDFSDVTDVSSCRFNDYKMKIRLTHLVSKENFHPEEKLLSCNSNDFGFLVAGDLGLMFEFYRNKITFLKRYVNKSWRSVKRVEGFFLIFELKNSCFFKKLIHSDEAPKPYFKVDFEYPGDLFAQNLLEYDFENQLLIMGKGGSKIAAVTYNDMKNRFFEDNFEQEKSLNELFSHSIQIQSMKFLNQKKIFFVDSSSSCCLIQYYSQSMKSTLLNKIHIKHEYKEIQASKIDVSSDKTFAVVCFGFGEQAHFLAVIGIRLTKRLELKKKIDYSQLNLDVIWAYNASSFYFEESPKIEKKLKIKNKKFLKKIDTGADEPSVHLSVGYRMVEGRKRHFFNLSSLSEKFIGFEMEAGNLLEGDQKDDVERNKIMGVLGYQGQKIIFDNFGNFFSVEISKV